jgi:signal transduction histidine kinase
VTRDDDGTPLRMVGTVIDITRRKRAEEARRRAEERARLSEELASLGTLSAGIAHDVGTPVNVILGYARMMTSSLQDAKNRERAALIAEQAQRVANLIQTLLNVARPGERIHSPVQMAGVLDTALSFVQERLSGHGIALERRLAPVPDVRGDPDRLQQVFLNLFMNASDAMPDGGALRIELSTSDDAHVEIAVEDSGPGIPAEHLGRVFEPFFTTKPRGKGCGLGLLVSRRILIEHGGTIDVASEIGRGTRFRIRLPVKTVAQEAERNKRGS